MILYLLASSICFVIALLAASYYLGQQFTKRLTRLGCHRTCPSNEQAVTLLQQQPFKETFSFLVLGDIQAGFKNLTKMTCSVEGQDLSFIIQTGDLVSHADEAHYALTLHEIKNGALPIPFFIVAGNHDVKGNPELFEKYIGTKQFFFQWSGCLFIVMDNSLGPPYAPQFRWLETVLQRNHPEARRTFIFMHREPIEWERGEPHPAIDDYAPFFELMERFHVDCVMSGHVHSYRRMQWNNTTFISNGNLHTCCATLITVTAHTICAQKVIIRTSFITRVEGKILDCLVAHIYPFLKNLLHYIRHRK